MEYAHKNTSVFILVLFGLLKHMCSLVPGNWPAGIEGEMAEKDARKQKTLTPHPLREAGGGRGRVRKRK